MGLSSRKLLNKHKEQASLMDRLN